MPAKAGPTLAPKPLIMEHAAASGRVPQKI